MICIPIFYAAVSYVVALIGTYGVITYSIMAIRRAVAGDPVWIFCLCIAVLSFFAAKDTLANCFEAIRIVRQQQENRRA